jgi:S-ribosylhomocysteine lyase
MELKRIASFSVDHTRLGRGMYLSRRDGDVLTYDLRMKVPNAGDYLAVPALHTIEHLFATYARSSELSDEVVYVGPMGCRTGFYLLVRGMTGDEAVALARASFAFIADYDGPIPGASAAECGNWLDHDLPGARAEAAAYLPVLDSWTAARLAYPT